MQILRKLHVNMERDEIMFENAGEKLSKIIKFVTVLGMTACVILGITLGIEKESFLTLILVSALGSVCIWISSLFTIALLDMMNDINNIKRLVNQIEDKITINSNESLAQVSNTDKVNNIQSKCDD